MLKLKAFDCRMCASKANCPDYEDPVTSPGLLSKACSEFKPHVPGPSDADPNIMELCFHNGERHMKEKILKLLVGYSRASGNTFGPVYEHIISEVEKL